MARIEGVDPKQTSLLMRQVFKKVRKMLGRDLTPQKIQARVPRVFWASVLTEWLLGQKAAALLRMADAMAETPSNVSNELYAELRRHFSEEELIELAASAAQENFRARYNRVFDVGSDGLYRKGLQFKQRRVA